MSWASGSILLQEVADIVMPLIPKDKRAKAAKKLIEAFMGEDCDTINEVDQEDIINAYNKMYPYEH